MKVSIGQLKGMQESIGKQISTRDSISLNDIRYIAGFDVKFVGDRAVVAAIVLDFKTLQVVEKKILDTKAHMSHVPGLVAFREGPLMLQAYYDLEYEPEVILVDGEGISHEQKAGLACFVGIELQKPVIGVSATQPKCDIDGDNLLRSGEILGKIVKTKEFANPVYVSPGHLIGVDTSAQIVKRCIVAPHKMPEPLHIARRSAGKAIKNNEISS